MFSNEDAAQEYVNRMNEIEGEGEFSYAKWTVLDKCPPIYQQLVLTYWYDRSDHERRFSNAHHERIPTAVITDNEECFSVIGTDIVDVYRVYNDLKERKGFA